jgi:hypothetical protein
MVYVNIGTDDPAYCWKKYLPVKLTIHPETFTATRKDHFNPKRPEVYREYGNVECSFGNRRQTVEAVRYQNGSVSVFGFVGNYETSKRLWRVDVSWHPVAKTERESWEGDEHRPNGSKNVLIYNPTLWRSLTDNEGRAKDWVTKIARLKK